MKISELIQRLASAQMERGDIPVMIPRYDMDENEVAVLQETKEIVFEELESVEVEQIGFRFITSVS
jgi:hypothetical protein